MILLNLLVIFAIIYTKANTEPVIDGTDVGEVVKYLNKLVVKNPGTFSYVAHLEIIMPFEKEGKTLYEIGNCGGVIIENDVILTAAHCLTAPTKPEIWAWAGILDTEIQKGKGQRIAVKEIIPHESYSERTQGLYNPNDIALLKLTTPFKLDGKYITLAKLPEMELDYEERIGWIVGWGDIECGKETTMLQKALMKTISQQRCQRYYKDAKITDKVICVFSYGKTAGDNIGDSGGPLVVNGTVVGLSSFGLLRNIIYKDGKKKQTCITQVPAVYTDVSKYIGWIRKQLGKPIPSPPKRSSSLKYLKASPPPTPPKRVSSLKNS